MYNFNEFKNSLKKVSDNLAREYSQVHTGVAAPSLLDLIMVESYGALVPLKNVASVSIEDPRTLRIAPWDKTQVKGIEKAISSSDLGLSLIADDQGIRAIFPQLTTERRTLLVKVLKEKLENARITLRQERDKVWTDIQNQEKEGKLTEDDKFRLKEELQKIIDTANQSMESAFEKKQKEILG